MGKTGNFGILHRKRKFQIVVRLSSADSSGRYLKKMGILHYSNFPKMKKPKKRKEKNRYLARSRRKKWESHVQI
jgi:hypothetical protein